MKCIKKKRNRVVVLDNINIIKTQGVISMFEKYGSVILMLRRLRPWSQQSKFDCLKFAKVTRVECEHRHAFLQLQYY